MTPRPTAGIFFEVEDDTHAGQRLNHDFANGLHVHGPGGEIFNLSEGPFRLVAERKISRLQPAANWKSLPSLTWYDRPYEFALGVGVLLEADDLLRWLSDNRKWKRDDGGFYLADVMRIDGIDGKPPCTALFDAEGVKQLEEAASRLFGERLCLHGPIAAHRLRQGQTVGIHSDTPAKGEETHRIVVFLGEDWPLPQGGHFLLLEEHRPLAVKSIIPHANNTVFAFRLWHRSFHAVTTVTAGQRFSLVLSFRKTS